VNGIGAGGLQDLGNPLSLLRGHAIIQSRLGAINQDDDGKVLAVEPFYLSNDVNNNLGAAFQATDAISVLALVPGARYKAIQQVIAAGIQLYALKSGLLGSHRPVAECFYNSFNLGNG
jgi:hypothetical protein